MRTDWKFENLFANDMPKIALIAGATGLVGSSLITLLLESDHYAQVISIQRKASAISNPKLKVIQTDFINIEFMDLTAIDDVFCCLGTTIKKAGSKAAFYKVDFEYPLALAQLGLHAGATHFLLITALGANPSSAFFYNRVKGAIEQKLMELPYKTMSVLRPSLLLGERKEKRTGEKIGMAIAGAIRPLLKGPLKKYRGILAVDVAKAMYAIALNPGKEHVHIYLSDRLQEIAANR